MNKSKILKGTYSVEYILLLKNIKKHEIMAGAHSKKWISFCCSFRFKYNFQSNCWKVIPMQYHRTVRGRDFIKFLLAILLMKSVNINKIVYYIKIYLYLCKYKYRVCEHGEVYFGFFSLWYTLVKFLINPSYNWMTECLWFR